MRKVIGIGETILDILFRDQQPSKAVPGGTVFNGLISLSRIGMPALFISEAGDDKVGEVIRKFMLENGLSTEYVDFSPEWKTPIALAFLDEKSDASYMVYKNYSSQRLNTSLPPIEENDVFIMGSYYALNPSLREQLLKHLEYAQERKSIIYYDLNFREPHAHEALKLQPAVIENLEYADIVRCAEEDLFYLFGSKDIQSVYDEKIAFYCKNFIVTHGEKGVTLFAENIKEHYDASQIKPVSTVGAGDNFNAGLIWGLIMHNIEKNSLRNLDLGHWGEIIRSGMDFATDVCQSYDNYISNDFASFYREKLTH